MADLDLAALRDQWVGRIFQEIDIVVDRERMLEWAITCGETDPRFIDPEHPDFQASTSFPTHVNAARMLPEDFTVIGSGRGIDGGKSIEWHRPMRAGQQLQGRRHFGQRESNAVELDSERFVVGLRLGALDHDQ
jgi:hypothetical protein